MVDTYCGDYKLSIYISNQDYNYFFETLGRIKRELKTKKEYLNGILGRRSLILPLLKCHFLKRFTLILV